jgi:hypothetical protein
MLTIESHSSSLVDTLDVGDAGVVDGLYSRQEISAKKTIIRAGGPE